MLINDITASFMPSATNCAVLTADVTYELVAGADVTDDVTYELVAAADGTDDVTYELVA